MIKLSNKVDLCSINVYEYLIEDVNLLNSFIEYAKNTEYTDQNSNYRSVNTYILHDKKLNNLKNVLIDCVDDAIKLIYNQVNFKAHLTQSWINLNRLNDFHFWHSHANSFLSGILYLYEDEDMGKTHFRVKNPWYDSNLCDSFEPYKEQHELLNYIVNDIIPEIGKLIIFPSSLEHSVMKNKTPKDRLTVSFNTFISGELGDKDLLNHLKV